MRLTHTSLVLIAAGGSAVLLLGAFGFQHLGGLAPCKLCLWQRWPHAVAVVIGVLALMLPGRVLPLAGALVALCSGALGLYHMGVEQGWWLGPATCSSAQPGNLSADALFEQIMAAPVVRCDEIPWQMLGLSMAGWNMVLSVALAAVWVMAARKAG
ncbi:disulfide bond formation protein B [Roseovarius amoyensis]|uniref:disulfide bond formation protein B n=1 Tax=Roseovarius amoyensis TaxID=2211448 RepID=UPI000DBE5373|nr:disulfide bond formation protein B [Roseovarius amoyensis]